MRALRTSLLLVLAGCDAQVWEFDAGAAPPGRVAESDASSTCDAACPEGETCRAGRCECSAQTTRCGPLCVNLLTSVLHCGACNQACTGNQLCQNGQCQ